MTQGEFEGGESWSVTYSALVYDDAPRSMLCGITAIRQADQPSGLSSGTRDTATEEYR
jgi:hypothetical protein